MRDDINCITDVIQIVRNMVCKQVKIPGFKLEPLGSGNNAYWINLPATARLYMTEKRDYPYFGILFHLTYDKKISLPRIDWPKSTISYDEWGKYIASTQHWIIEDKATWPEHLILEDRVMTRSMYHLESLIDPGFEKAKELIQLYVKNWQKTSNQ